VTLDAFVRAGFEVVALLNEPSAAALEYAHRYRSTITAKREYVLIYDLGGGTFDASLLKMTGRLNEVVTSEGIRHLGGNDFDEAILKLVLKGSKLREPDAATLELLLEECAVRKEAVGPNTRRFLVDLSAAAQPPFSCGIDEVYAACAPLVEKTVELLPRVLCDRARDGGGVDLSEVAGIYAVGGAGRFPLVTRTLRRSFGEKHVSAHRTPLRPRPSAWRSSSTRRPASHCPSASRAISGSSARRTAARTSSSTRSCRRTSRFPPMASPRS
jgi:molecular chaperone DnaK